MRLVSGAGKELLRAAAEPQLLRTQQHAPKFEFPPYYKIGGVC